MKKYPIKKKYKEVYMIDKNVLVTGGAGFVGSHLCDLLLSKGYNVTCVDNLITGSMKNICHIKSDKFLFMNHDVTEPLHIDEKIDFIFHLASPASPKDYLELPIETMKAGSFGTYYMLEFAKKHNSRFLVSSTSEIYGDPSVNIQSEEYWGNVNSIGPRSVYDEAKRFSEAMTMAFHRYFDLDIRIVRIFNTYGNRMRVNDGRAVPNFIRQALLNEDITIYGDGSQTRSFCHVNDEVEGIYRLMMSDYNLPMNIGNPDEYTVLQLADMILEITKSSSKVTFEDLPIDDPKQRRPDITKARNILKWEPVIPIREGLRETIEYFKNILI